MKFYKIIPTSGMTDFVKSGKNGVCQISCHDEEPKYLSIEKNRLYVKRGKKLVLTDVALSFNYKNKIVSYEEITEEKFQEILNKMIEKI